MHVRRILMSSALCLLCAVGARADDAMFFFSHLNVEGQLGWFGDPPLQGPVRVVRLAQYAGRRLPDGRIVKSEPPRVVYRAALYFDARGRGVRVERQSDFLGHTILEYPPNGDRRKWFSSSPQGPRSVSLRRVRRNARGCPEREDYFAGDRFVRTEERAFCDGQGRKAYVRNSLGQRRIFAYDARGNRILDEWFDYDAAGRPRAQLRTRSVYDDGNRLSRRSIWEYLGRERQALTNSPEDWRENGEDYEYDAAGRLVRTRSWRMEGARRVYEPKSGQLWEYDAAGLLTRRRYQEVLDAGVHSLENRYAYDADGHPVGIVHEEFWPGNENGPAQRKLCRLTFRSDSRGNWIWAVRDDEKPAVFEREISYYSR